MAQSSHQWLLLIAGGRCHQPLSLVAAGHYHRSQMSLSLNAAVTGCYGKAVIAALNLSLRRKYSVPTDGAVSAAFSDTAVVWHCWQSLVFTVTRCNATIKLVDPLVF